MAVPLDHRFQTGVPIVQKTPENGIKYISEFIEKPIMPYRVETFFCVKRTNKHIRAVISRKTHQIIQKTQPVRNTIMYPKTKLVILYL